MANQFSKDIAEKLILAALASNALKLNGIAIDQRSAIDNAKIDAAYLLTLLETLTADPAG